MKMTATMERLARLEVDSYRLVVLVAVGASLGALLFWQPLPVLGATAGAIALAGLAGLAHREPRRALELALALVLVAGTKFRERDPALSMAGSADWQVLFELAVHGSVAVIVAIVHVTAARRRPLPVSWVEVSLVAFALFALLSALWSPIPLLSAVRGMQLLTLTALAWVALRVLGVEQAVTAAGRALLVYVLLCAASAVVLPSTVVAEAALATERFAWLAAHPLWVAMSCGLAAIWVVSRLVVPDAGPLRARTVMLALSLIPLGAILVATRSRTAMVALVVASVALLLRRFTPAWMATVMICVAVGVLAVFPITDLSPVDVVERLEGAEGPLAEFLLRGQTAQEVVSLNGRVELWGALGSLIAERPLAGHGYLSSRDLVVDLVSWAREGAYAHNELAQTMLDFGLIGTLLFWAPFLSALVPGSLRGRAAPPGLVRARATIFGAAVFLLLNAMTSEGLVAPPGFGLLVVCLLAMSASRLRHLAE